MKLTILNPSQETRLALMSRPVRLTDYIEVSHLDVMGRWELGDCMSVESRVKLAVLANAMEKEENHDRAKRRHAGIV